MTFIFLISLSIGVFTTYKYISTVPDVQVNKHKCNNHGKIQKECLNEKCWNIDCYKHPDFKCKSIKKLN
jgi:hypothetical protein